VNHRVAVVGGGWAGCAAALTLAEAGVAVTLFEAAASLGGRARAVDVGGRTLDNGQHILLGAYSQTLQLLARLHGGETPGLMRLPLVVEQPPDFRLACPRLPAPLHLLAGLLGARGLGWREKWQAARGAATLLRGRGPQADTSVSTLLAGQPEKLRHLLWEPLCLSALNTPPESASAATYRRVLAAAFGAHREHSDLLLPCRELGALFPDPAAARVVQLGGTVRTRARVRELSARDDEITVATGTDAKPFDRLVLAVAPQHLATIAHALPGMEATLARVAAFRYEPIATAYLQYPSDVRLARPMLALPGAPGQYVFDRGQTHGDAGLLALVVSAAAGLLGQPHASWLAAAEAQLASTLSLPPALWRRGILEKQATYACVPDLSRPAVRTGHPWVFIAGDYTAGPYPATIESATLSGVQSALALLDSL